MKTRQVHLSWLALALSAVVAVQPGLLRAQTPEFLLAWGSSGSGPGQFYAVLGVAVAPDGNIYATDAGNNRIQVFTNTGEFLTQWGSTGTGNGQFNRPYGIAVAANGDVYVADSNNHRIQKFAADGSYLTQWGSFGFGPNQFRAPVAVAIDVTGRVFVGEGGNSGVKIFSGTGTLLERWGNVSPTEPFGPVLGIDFDAGGNIYLAHTSGGYAKVDRMTSAGVQLQRFEHVGYQVGVVTLGVAVDAAGHVYVLEGYYEQIAIFDPGGSIAGVFGSRGSGESQFALPYGLALDASDNLYVADAGNHRIQKFGPYGATPTHTSTWGRLKGLYR